MNNNNSNNSTVYAIKDPNATLLIQSDCPIRRFSSERILEEFPLVSGNCVFIPDDCDFVLINKSCTLRIAPLISGIRTHQLPLSPQLSSPASTSPNSPPPPHLSQITITSTNERIPRPKNKFILFSNDVRAEVQREHPNEPNKVISKHIGRMWKELGEEAQNEYAKRAQRVADKHEEDHPDYKYNPKKRGKK